MFKGLKWHFFLLTALILYLLLSVHDHCKSNKVMAEATR